MGRARAGQGECGYTSISGVNQGAWQGVGMDWGAVQTPPSQCMRCGGEDECTGLLCLWHILMNVLSA